MPRIERVSKRNPDQQTHWVSGDAYESYVGRWSRLVAGEFLSWLGVAPSKRWLDVGCGAGALSQTILAMTAPDAVYGIDLSKDFVSYARRQAEDRISFIIGDARSLPYKSRSFDMVVSGLALNFVPEPASALSEMTRVVVEDGAVAVYVWDYADNMQMMRYFWDAAARLNGKALEMDEGRRFPICKPEPLMEVFYKAGLKDVEHRAIDAPTAFKDFDDYWNPFLGGQGPAPGYALSLKENERNQLRDLVRAQLPIRADGSIHLVSRAWAMRGRR
jgi:ubiquinone/menaquinone biosynthesis C-methylase UbiE